MRSDRQQFLQALQQEWSCPITSEAMIDPVVTADGITYERTAILQWFNKLQTSPKTGLVLVTNQLIPNIALRNIIKKFKNQQHSFLKKSIIVNYKSPSQQQKQLEQFSKNKNMLKQKNKQIRQLNDIILQLREQVKDLQQIINDLLEDKQKSNQLQQPFFFKQQFPKLPQKKKIPKIASKKKVQEQKFKPQLKKHNFKLAQSKIAYEYLITVFNSDQKVKQKYYQTHKNASYSLNHQGIPIDMEQFVLYDWRNVQFLDLKNTMIDNKQWRIFVQNAHKFPFLTSIEIYNNQITQVLINDLKGFSSLKQIWFYHNYGGSNPLTSYSKQNLAIFKLQNPKMEVNF